MTLRRRIFGAPGERTQLALGLVDLGVRVGVTPYNWRLLTSIRRHRWLLARNGRIPYLPAAARAPNEVTPDDVALCRRLTAAYRAAVGRLPSGSGTSGMWSWIYKTRQSGLSEILDSGDAPALARELASMFRKTFVIGFAPGSLIAHSESPLGARIWRLKALDALVSVAEAQGVVPVEGPEQGETGLAFQHGLRDLVEKVEQSLGFSIDFPDVGAPFGIEIDGRLVTIDSPDQLYTAMRIDHALGLHLDGHAATTPSIVEIGGGYGALCLWLMRRSESVSRYTIVDLPVVNVLQGYFLSRALGSARVSLFGEEPAEVRVLPNTALSDVDAPYDVLVSKDSLPEIPELAALEYLRWARSTCAGIFYSSNQESTAPFLGERQGVVADLVARAGGFERLRRDQSWVRPGYVEEVYEAAGEARSVRCWTL